MHGKQIDALLTVALTPHIRRYLAEHDPKCQEQVDDALMNAEGLRFQDLLDSYKKLAASGSI